MAATTSARDIFLAARDRDPAERGAYLDAACGGDDALRRRVQALLRADAESGAFLSEATPGAVPPDGFTADVPAEGQTATFGSDAGSTADFAGKDEHVGAILGGKYKLIEAIGEGGMGSVYLAQQTEPVKRAVAVKVIKAGMDSKAVLARFEAERQALAMMDHPNIARVLDAGTTESGRPYFVMELVKGVPITQFCDERKLTPRQRLELFVPVCNAIQHAHMKGVIHRDIKPSNVLVALYDDRPVPKVIDFGVAKAAGQTLTDKTLMTGFGAVVGTPEYMSPEQASLNNLDIDTRSDVYSLGVLLYELLTGHTPVDRKSLGKAALLEVLRIVREVEAPRPSAKLSTSDAMASISANRDTEPKKLTDLLRSELDWIVMKALEKDRTRRYDTANGFAADVQRYLSGEQVQAVPPSLGYRLGKAYRRNRAAVWVGSAFAAVLLAACVVCVVFGVLAKRAEQSALTNEARAVKAQAEAAANEDLARSEAAKATAAQEKQAADRYLSDAQLLPLAFDKGTPAEVLKLLDSHRPKPGEPDRRGFEWHYWNRQQNPQTVAERLPDCEENAHTAWAVSPDGRRIARIAAVSGAEELPVLTVWDRATRQVVRKHRLPIRPPVVAGALGTATRSAVAPLFSPDGRRVVVKWSYSSWGRVRPGEEVGPGGPNPIGNTTELRQVLDVDTGKTLLEPPGTGGFTENDEQFSRDGRRFACVDGVNRDGKMTFTFHVWDLATGEPVALGEPLSRFSSISLHPDGETCLKSVPADGPHPATAAAVGGLAHLPATRLARCDLRTGKELWATTVPFEGIAHPVVSADGKWVAGSLPSDPDHLSDRDPPTIAVAAWDADTGRQVWSWPVPVREDVPWVTGLTFSPRGTRLVVSRVWNGRKAVASPIQTVLDVRSGVAYPPLDGLRELTFLDDRLPFSPDENRVIHPDRGTLRTIDVRTGATAGAVRGPAEAPVLCQFTPDGDRLWSVEPGGVYKEWPASRPRAVAVGFEGRLKAGPEEVVSASLTSEFAVSADGGRFAHLVLTHDASTGAHESGVRVRDADGQAEKLLTPPPRAVPAKGRTVYPRCGLAFSRDGGRVLLTRSEELGIGVGQPMPAEGSADLPFPDLTVWDTATGQRLLYLRLDGPTMPAAAFGGSVAALSADGRRVAVAMEPAKAGDPVVVRQFDVDTSREETACTLAGVSGLFTLAFSPDGRRLASVSATHDKVVGRVAARVVVWDAAGGEAAVTADLYRDAKAPARFGYRSFFRAWVGWTPDGTGLVISYNTAGSGFALHDAATGKPVVSFERIVDRKGAATGVAVGPVCSPDGKRVAAVLDLNRDGRPAVKVWDTASGKEVLTLRKRENAPLFNGGPSSSRDRQLAFTPDGHQLLAWEFREMPDGSPEQGDSTLPAYVRTLWDASPPPEAKK